MDGFFVVVAFGDSLTAGFQNRSEANPYGLSHPYARILHNLLWDRVRELGLAINPVVEVEAEPGSSTRGMLRRFDYTVPRHRPDAVAVWGGINDLTSGVSAVEAAGNLREIVEKTKRLYASAILLSLTPVIADETITSRVIEYNAAIHAVAEEMGAAFVDVYTPLADAEGLLKSEYSNDGTHLSDAGYTRIGEQVFSAVASLLSA